MERMEPLRIKEYLSEIVDMLKHIQIENKKQLADAKVFDGNKKLLKVLTEVHQKVSMTKYK